MVSQTAEYALRAMVVLGRLPDQPQTTESLAEATQVPIPYLHKVLRQLALAKLLKIQRGRHGGFRLSRPPAEIRLLDVINVIAPIAPIERCPLGLPIHAKELCPLHHRLDEVIRSIIDAYTSTTLAELVQTSSQVHGLCRQDSPAHPSQSTNSTNFSV